MPNHVTTRCTVTGSTDELAKFKALMIVTDEHTSQQGFDFQRLIPMPPHICNTVCGSEILYEDSCVEEFTERMVRIPTKSPAFSDL